MTFWLKKDYSPEQIVGVAKKEAIACVSIERIYQFIWDDKKKGGDYTNTFEQRESDIGNQEHQRISEDK